jgi:hypothetical protein
MKREYKVFKDEEGKKIVIWSDMIDKCLFAGSIGKLEEIESGCFERDENQLENIMSVARRYPETEEQKEQKKKRIFNAYKQRITTNNGPRHNTTRFNVVEYLCRYPEINPYEMAANILKEGWTIEYDDSSISEKDNDAKRRKVEILLKLQEV